MMRTGGQHEEAGDCRAHELAVLPHLKFDRRLDCEPTRGTRCLNE